MVDMPPKPTPKETEIIISDSGQATKPKRKSRSKKETGISQSEISNLIIGCFSLVSLKAGDHWNITEDEALQVSKPLESILLKMNLLDKVSNCSDGAMLAFAVASITLPRILISRSQSENKKKTKLIQLKGGFANGKQQPTIEQHPTRNIDTEQIKVDDSPETRKANLERAKEIKSIHSKLNNPLYSTNAQ
jgi:hypothetical protein